MKNFLQLSLHTDLVGISSMKLHADPVLVEPPNVFRYDICEKFFQESFFQSSTKQECYINQCTDPSEGGWLTDIRFLFGGIRFLFDVRLFESIVEGASRSISSLPSINLLNLGELSSLP